MSRHFCSTENCGGIKEGTRSGLYYEGIRIIKETEPKYSIIENVKNLTSKRFKDTFEQILKDLEELGYNNYYKVMNAKNYGVPQNRERIFIVSIRKDIDNHEFNFPEPFDSGIRLKDILEDNVEEKFFISEKMMKGFLAHNERHEKKGTGFIWKPRDVEKNASALRANPALAPTDNTVGVMVRKGGIFDKENERHQAGSIYDKEGISPPLDTMQGGYRQPMVDVINATKKGYDTATIGDSINLTYPGSNKKRGRVGHGCAQTLDTSCSQATIVYDKPLERKGWHNKACEVLNPVGICTCIHTQSNNLLQKVKVEENRFFKQAQETYEEHECNEGDTINAFNKKVNTTGISPTVTSRPERI